MTFQELGSRLNIVGEFVLETPLRISAGSEGVALDTTGNPMIPASTFRGALRAYIEALIRALQTDRHDVRQTITLRGPEGRPVQRLVRLCCDSVDKRDDDLNYQGCLTKATVARWQNDPAMRLTLDSAIVDCTCTICRLFGTTWLAGRVQVADLLLIGGWSGQYETRSGITIRRDTGVALEGSGYQHKAVPAGTQFSLRLSIENASWAEHGIILAGLRAFEAGLISLGSDRAHGFGRGHLALDWENCRWIDSNNLINVLLNGAPAPFTESDAEARIAALVDLLALKKPTK